MERELAEMTGSLEQLAGLEEKEEEEEEEEEEESGSSVYGSLKVRGLLNTRSAFWREVFAAIAKNVGQKESGSCPAVVVEGVEVCGGRVRCVGVVKVCGTVLEMGQ